MTARAGTAGTILKWRVCWNDTQLPVDYPGFTTVMIRPGPRYPLGRKGMVLCQQWEKDRDATTRGVLFLDGDVAVDPADMQQMLASVSEEPRAVHVAPARIWPVTTGQDTWVWGHWRAHSGQQIHPDPRFFSFCFTYVPAGLMSTCVRGGMGAWVFPDVDSCLARRAWRADIPVNVVQGCFPVHVHF